jgi:hypothetical protein
MTNGKLHDRLQNYSSCVNIEGANKCFDAFEKLLSAHNISISALPEMNAQDVVRWGLPLTFIDPIYFTGSVFSNLVKSIENKGCPIENDFAEIDATSLLLALGAKTASKISNYNNKVHDFNVEWSDTIIEVEVTKASTKVAHVERTNQATDVCERIFQLGRPFDIYFFIPDLLKEEEKSKLLKAASTIVCGQTCSNQQLWQIQTIPIVRDVDVLFSTSETEPTPSWWPIEVANLFIIKQMGAGPECKKAPPQVRIYYTVPMTGYINPVRKKAKNFQGTLSKPFLIAVDSSNLPNPVSTFKKGLESLFLKWPHISGVLLFFSRLSYKEIGWEFKLFANNNASRPLPEELIDKIGRSDRTMKLVRKDS